MIVLRMLIVSLWLCLGLSSPLQAGEREERQKLDYLGLSHFINERFSDLEELTDTWRNDEVRTGSGVWKLAVFYRSWQSHLFTAFQKHDPAQWQEDYDRFDRWLAQYPHSSTARIAKALYMIEEAWQIAGGKKRKLEHMSGTDLERFAAQMRKARRYVLDIREIASIDPHWYVARAQTWRFTGMTKNEFLTELEEGFSRNPEYLELYAEAVRYLVANGGSRGGAYEKLANSAAYKTSEKRGMAYYARVYWLVYGNAMGSYLFGSDAAPDWTKMRQGMDDVLKNFPADYNRQFFAWFSCLSRDREKIQQYINAMVTAPLPIVWEQMDYFKQCRDFGEGKLKLRGEQAG